MDLFSRESLLLYAGESNDYPGLIPEVEPCYLTTAFNMKNLSEVHHTYETKGYTYIRTRNPNRTALAKAISFLEGGEASLILSSGMAAITSTLITILNNGDHVLCNANIYGETYDVFVKVLSKMNITAEFVDFTDLAAVKQALTPKTRLLYTEVVSNPTLALADIAALGEIAHATGALLMVDNTFTTPMAIKPIKLGADIVINSLTKFVNGHCDALGGSVTASETLIDQIMPMSMLIGTPGDPFDSWLILRGLQTLELRMAKQMENARKLALALQTNNHVSKVNHPSLPDYPQKALAEKLFTDLGVTPMLSFILPEDTEKIDQFMQKLHFAKYAPTLGGIRTTMSHPVTSSHPNVPDPVRRKMGITPGMIRISTGIEKAEDLIKDFEDALSVFDA